MDERLEAIRLGIPYQFLIKEKKLAEILGTISQNLHEKVVLKGGTALNFVYLHKRFSEDIDLDLYSQKNPLEKMNLKGPFKMGNVLRYHYEYEEDGLKDYIRIEIAEKKGWKIVKNFVRRGMLKFFHGSIVANIPVYSLEFLIATKIFLVSTRFEGKDCFDLYNGLKVSVPSKKEIKAVEKLENRRGIIELAIRKLEEADVRFLSKSNQFIPRVYRPQSWRIVVDETIEMLQNLKKKMI